MQAKLFLGSFFFCLFFLLLSCSPSAENAVGAMPGDIIQPDSLVTILTEVHISEAILREMKTDTKHKEKTAQNYYSEIFAKHGITRHQYEKSIEYYQQHPEIYQDIYEKVITRLSQKQTENTSNEKETD